MLKPWNEGKNRREREPELTNQLDLTLLSRSLCTSLLPRGAPGADLALQTWLSHPKIPWLVGRSPPSSQGHGGGNCCRPGMLGWMQAVSGCRSLIWH